MGPTHTKTLSVTPEPLNQTSLHPELPGQQELVQGHAGDHNVVWRPMHPLCGPSTSRLEGFHTLLYDPHKCNVLFSEGWHWLQAALETTRCGRG